MWKGENKNFRSVSLLPDANRKFQKNSKKVQKIKKYHYGFIWSQNGVKNGCKREKIKIFVPFPSYPSRNRKFQKNSKKVQKIKKYHYGFILSQMGLKMDVQGEK